MKMYFAAVKRSQLWARRWRRQWRHQSRWKTGRIISWTSWTVQEKRSNNSKALSRLHRRVHKGSIVRTYTLQWYSLVLNRRHGEPEFFKAQLNDFLTYLMKISVICPVAMTKSMSRILVVLSNNWPSFGRLKFAMSTVVLCPFFLCISVNKGQY